MKFYNREAEIEELHRIKERAFNDHSRMVVVTGRRRIGKTSLVKRAFIDGDAPFLYFFTTRKAESDLVADFTAEIKAKLDIYFPDNLPNMATLLRLLFEMTKSRRFTLLIDEFQDFDKVNPTIFSELQNIWDTFRLETNVNLILSGSVFSMMKKIFEDEKEPLFGRADNFIRLKPFRINVMKEIMADFNPDYTPDDLLTLYTISGGIPKYVELLLDNGYVTSEEMLRRTTSAVSPFIEEGRTLLINEFGKDYGKYFSVLLAIASGIDTQAAISASLGDISVGGHIEKLENTYNIISRYRPIGAKENSKNNVHFRITDNFLQFWFRFIEKNRSLVELENYDDLTNLLLSQYKTYSGQILERYFQKKLAEEGGYREIGNWWEPRLGKEASEIDIVAIRTIGKKALVAEVKRQRRNYDHKQFMAKVERIKATLLSSYEVDTRLLTLEDI